MPVISIIGCRMFEDEIMHLIENDPEIEKIVLIENEDCEGIRKKMLEAGIRHETAPVGKLPGKHEASGFTLNIFMLELALHAIPENLKKTVYSKVQTMVPYSEGILLFYGLCGNVLGKIEHDLQSQDCKILILKEQDGEIVDDCIGAALGGRKQYLSALKNCKGVGTFFLTPMWAANWREMIRTAGLSQNPDDIEMSKFVFDYAGYKRAARINTGLKYEKTFEANIEEFARLFDFELIDLEGTTGLVENCYMQIKKSVAKTSKTSIEN